MQPECTYYHKDISSHNLASLKSEISPLIIEEAKMLSNLGIKSLLYFSKLYKNKRGDLTATDTILIDRLEELDKYRKVIGFEMDKQKQQFELLLNARGLKTKEQIREIIIKFYKLVPAYLRGIKRIKSNKWLTEEDKIDLMREENDTPANYHIIRTR